MQKITPYLWFDGQAEEAANLYVSLFPNSKITSVTPWGEGSPYRVGTAMTVQFQLDGQNFVALNGGPQYRFTEAVSFLVSCETQQEIDRLWNALTADGGEESMCGWLKDKYGLSWQIVPPILGELMSDKDSAKAGRVVQAMLQMKKLDIGKLKQAYEGK
jgi:predicted 3-demethylubiquinone-9 3-methyltransferase (glyoxalase superfamily)